MTTLPELNLTADPVDSLTVPELRVGAAKLRGDLIHAITAPTADRVDALAIVGWLHEKRTNPRANLATWAADDVTFVDIMRALHFEAPEPAEDPEPADSEPAEPETPRARKEAAAARRKALDDKVGGDPTDPTP